MKDSEKLKPFRERLRSRREELLARHGRLREEINRQAQDENASFEEQAGSGEFDDVIDTLSEMEVRELQEIDDALFRIRDGAYGKCVECGRPIPEERLAAIPSTPFCARCGEAASRSDQPAG